MNGDTMEKKMKSCRRILFSSLSCRFATPAKHENDELQTALQQTVSRWVALVSFAAALGTVMFVAGCSTRGAKQVAAANTSTATQSYPEVETVKVMLRRLDMVIPLPGELLPYQEVRIFPKVTGFLKWIGVDRGSRVRKGQVLARLEAPELVAQKFEAQAKLASAEHRQVAAEAKLAADQGTYQRLKVAAATPGVISDEELEVAQKAAQADQATVVSLRAATEAARETLRSVQTLEGYLVVSAPFDGIVTKRNVHPGALIGPAGGPGQAHSMVRIEEVSHLRLVVPVPEAYAAGITVGTKVSFTVAAFPGRTFSGTVARIADSLDQQTRTMPVELDVWNPDWTLYSGMFPQVAWPVHRPGPSLFVPQSAVARTMESTFVIRVRNGQTRWVTVKTGATSDGLVEVFADLRPGDQVALRASEELRPYTRVTPQLSRAGEATAPGNGP